MFAVVSLLDATHNALVHELWRKLEADCGLKGIWVAPIPHFSWHGALDYDMERLHPELQALALNTQPFKVRTAGLGIFSGEKPVIYALLTKDAPLLRLHEQIWERTASLGTGLNTYFAPPIWVPHITLAMGDVTHTNLPCMLETLAFQPFAWEIEINNITLIGQSERQIYEDCCSYRFGRDD